MLTAFLLSALCTLPVHATITAVQEVGSTVDNSAAATRAFSINVTAGNLVVVSANKYIAATDPFVSGDASKSAGTATIGTINFASSASAELNYHGGTDRIAIGVWWAIVTGSGSLTMQVGGSAADTYWTIAVGEYSATNGWDASSLEDSIVASDATDGLTTAMSGNRTSAGGALFLGSLAVISSSQVISITPDAAFTEIYEEQDASLHEAGSTIRRIVTSGTTDAAEWAVQNNNLGWIASLAVFKEAAGGGGGIVVNPISGRGGAAAQPIVP